MKSIFSWFKENYGNLLFIFAIGVAFILYAYSMIEFTNNKKGAAPLKEFKDGIQNHLIWDIKGQCFFVRPNDDVTVYLVRVQDCDKK